MDRVTENLLAKFTLEHALTSLAEDIRFEHFASYITVRQQHRETFDTTDIATGGGNDTGIDAIAILVNGQLVSDIDEFSEIASGGSLDVMFVFVQADRGAGFESTKIANFGFGVRDFFDNQPKLPRNKAITEAAAIMTSVYEKADKFRRGRPQCRLYYVTTGIWQNDHALEARRQAVIDDLQKLQIFDGVDFISVGADGIQKLYTDTKNTISKRFEFPRKTTAPEIRGVSEAFLGFVSAKEFLSIITDESGEIIRSIFYDNVRDWQGDNPVNSAMSKTLGSDIKDRFLLMNNGVTIIARSLTQIGDRVVIEDFQIVNGCQTSYAVFNNSENISDGVMVPLRLIATQDEDIITSIIEATNQQTAVRPEQFLAVTEFQKKLERFFASFADDSKLYYERRSRQYDAVAIERVRIVRPVDLIRAFAGMFLNEPHGTTRSYARLRERVGTDIFGPVHKLDPYYVAAFSLYRLEFLFRNQRLDPQYKPARFHLLLAARLLASPEPLPPMNSNAIEKYCAKLTKTLWDINYSDALFTRAADIVSAVAKGNFDRDTIRTQPFTTGVVDGCRKAIEMPAL
ncbi:MAG TPA: AIPR family protein [Stellaceae bacterium]|nr:AIPR family protein [Stellaceae bacterium]